MEERKKKERDFHNMIRLENEDAGVTETRWSPDLEKTIKNNPLCRFRADAFDLVERCYLLMDNG